MLAQSADAQALEKKVIAGYNAKLVSRVAALKAVNSGVSVQRYLEAGRTWANIYTQVKTWIWDSNAAFTKILDNPTQFGFVDATSFGGEKSFWG